MITISKHYYKKHFIYGIALINAQFSETVKQTKHRQCNGFKCQLFRLQSVLR